MPDLWPNYWVYRPIIIVGMAMPGSASVALQEVQLQPSNNPEILFYAKSQEDVPGRNRSINSKFDNDTASCDWLAGN